MIPDVSAFLKKHPSRGVQALVAAQARLSGFTTDLFLFFINTIANSTQLPRHSSPMHRSTEQVILPGCSFSVTAVAARNAQQV
jgi:hypothetical protein